MWHTGFLQRTNLTLTQGHDMPCTWTPQHHAAKPRSRSHRQPPGPLNSTCSSSTTTTIAAAAAASASRTHQTAATNTHQQQYQHPAAASVAAAAPAAAAAAGRVQPGRVVVITAATPAHRQQQQAHGQDAAVNDGELWYSSSSSKSSNEGNGKQASSSSSSSSPAGGGSSRRPASSSSSRGRFRRTAATIGPNSRMPPAAAGQAAAAATAAVSGVKAAAAEVEANSSSSSSSTDLPKQQEGPHHAAASATHLTISQDTNSSSSSNGSSYAGPSLSSQLPAGQLVQLQTYLDHLLEVNKVMNLTAIRDPQEAWERHIEDSLALLPIIDQYACSSSSSSDAGLSVIDVGTGAGLPGMVLAVVRPHWQVTLLDSLRKRCDFLEGTASMLGLSNVRVVWCRAEDGARQQDLRECHDVAVARAVAELRVLAELCLPFVRPGGVWVAAKGANPEDEVSAASKALSKLRGKLCGVLRVQSWAPEGQRTAVVVRKTQPTPPQFPRAPGTPSKKPL